jgi:outer membrane protein
MKKTLLFTVALLLASAGAATAQKFGYCNSLALLTQIPEVKQADSDLQAFQTQLTKKGQEMVKELQMKAEELQRKEQQGTISPKDLEAQTLKLKDEEEKIAKYEQEVYAKLAQKREELYKPLLEKVNNAMKDVATENGFTMVFDLSANVVLYGDPSLDVTNLVKTKLGITN